MRRIIIDTDCGSDDAVAIIMALKSKDIHVQAVTTVCGNIPVDLATKNALMTIEVVNQQKPPLYVGASKPLMKDLVTAIHVHGLDGMGDQNLIHPTLTPEKEQAVDAILRLVKTYPDEIEIVALGPVTNIALAILRDPETMKKVKHIYSMGTSGFGKGNITPVAEFNVYVDAEAYDIMLKANLPLTIIGFDLCWGEAALYKDELDMLLESNVAEAVFAVQCNKTLLEFNFKRAGKHFVDLPDPVAMAVALWKEVSIETVACYCHTCIVDPLAYGQVIVNDLSLNAFYNSKHTSAPNAFVCKKIDHQIFKTKLMDVLTT